MHAFLVTISVNQEKLTRMFCRRLVWRKSLAITECKGLMTVGARGVRYFRDVSGYHNLSLRRLYLVRGVRGDEWDEPY